MLTPPRISDFNPRSREGSDAFRTSIASLISIFQSTLPRGERPVFLIPKLFLCLFQSTLPRGERRFSVDNPLIVGKISIHAPARGATFSLLLHYIFHTISIHAPARGATVLRVKFSSNGGISIHAPARGATRGVRGNILDIAYFNPRSREGSDETDKGSYPTKQAFQSTLPRGERRRKNQRGHLLHAISIHAPARGATFPTIVSAALQIDFNPRSREGSDSGLCADSGGNHNFNPRSREGSDICSISFSDALPTFQSTLPRGERLLNHLCHFSLSLFQSTLPRGERPARNEEETVTSWISIHAPARGATSILSKIHPMFLTISHNASSFSSFPFHSFLPHLLNSSTFCALFQVRISRAFSVYYRFAPKKSTPDL